ncbi:flagellin [Devosia submarina]|uniref:flagellin N-terminal helical domain-containing protein n=1 Tax=Devosia submarina TaxID=1173082 RepID=UPI000D332D8F|nr:flagellin [Devosia submarina]
MADINLSKAVRSNLGSLQNTAALMSKTSDRLSTGNKVNTALDNPTNFFTASSLNSRAGDLNNLMDSMANGIKTIEAANNGLTSITKNLESMQSTLRQARQDKSFQTTSLTLGANLTSAQNLSFAGGAIGSTPVTIALGTAATTGTPAVPGTPAGADTPAVTSSVTGVGGAAIDAGTAGDVVVTVGTTDYTVSLDAGDDAAAVAGKINAEVGFNVADTDGGQLRLQNAAGTGISMADATGNVAGTTDQILGTTPAEVAGSPLVAGTPATTGTPAVPGTPAAAKTVDELVNEINNKAELKGKVRASNDDGKLRIENLSTQELNINGASSTGVVDGTSSGVNKVTGNTVRAGLAEQFNELRDQLDKLSDDASFNGINLLRGDKLKITFNETGTSSIDIQTKGEKSVDSTSLKLKTTLQAKDLDSDASIDKFLDDVKTALNDVRSQSSAFGSNLSIVQNRQDFTKAMIDTLETGAGNLTLADMNQEAANMMALQTRQSLAQSTLSMANQADQGVLQLLR